MNIMFMNDRFYKQLTKKEQLQTNSFKWCCINCTHKVDKIMMIIYYMDYRLVFIGKNQ